MTSICDILRVSRDKTFFYSRKYPGLVARAVRDLTFWRRFISSTAEAGFDYLLNRLPINVHRLSSDAATSFGMAGVLLFKQKTSQHSNVDGLFWQIKWDNWDRIVSLEDLSPGRVNIHVAEYMALLITCETFAKYCVGKLTYLEVDNTTAQSWFEAARCPKYPIDRCGQGVHLHMLEKCMKVTTRWVDSAANALADRCSRKFFPKKKVYHEFDGIRLQKVKPLWNNCIKYL